MKNGNVSIRVGTNRTGVGTSPLLTQAMLASVAEGLPSSPGNSGAVAAVRIDYARQAEPLGTMPPPATLKGVFKTAVEVLKGNKPSFFLDKVGERLAFERTGSRLYEAVISKFDAYGTWDGGPGRAELVAIWADEVSHFELLNQAMLRLGADPTAMTPSADLAAVASMGLLQVVTDPRTNLAQTLQAALIAELTDNDSWLTLTDLAASLGHDELAAEFQRAHRAEEMHLAAVRQWVTAHALAEAKRGDASP
ncbi:MAG TPA: ferritin-like domain-containing protein [Polyangiaceae bacterium]|nr:ferritin-like domain-containing protein [Polyangiaceae bacterium]